MLAILHLATDVSIAAGDEPQIGTLTLLVVVVTILLAWTAAFLWAVKWLLKGHFDAIDKSFEAVDARFKSLNTSIDSGNSKMQVLERDLLLLRAEIPENYVRREDWIRLSNAIDAKLDRIVDEIRSDGSRSREPRPKEKA